MNFYTGIFTGETFSQIVLVFAVVFYLVECFFGYRFLKLFVTLIGFCIGFLIGFFATLMFYTADAYVPTMVGILAGVGLALAAFKLYLLGVFLLCGALAARAAAQLPLSDSGVQHIIKVVLCLAAFLIVGILAVKFSEFCIIASSAVFGAINAVSSLSTPVAVLSSNMLLRIALTAALAVLGILVQRAMAGKKRR